MQTMDQFSHDLTLALEETSKGVLRGRWGPRRRTRSTGNLPCAPQPTEDSSSSPTDAVNEMQANHNVAEAICSLHSDSDDRLDFRSTFPKARHNFESDSLNENFSPARFFRPNKIKERRKRKFKRMAVEYETSPSTPGPKSGSFLQSDNLESQSTGIDSNTNDLTNSAISSKVCSSTVFPVASSVKKRVLKHASQDNYRTNLFFCGKRKRSHRDHRYHDHHDYYNKQHSSSVPRQSHIFTAKNSYPDHKVRTRSFSSSIKPNCEKILPLQKGLITKIEKMSAIQQQCTLKSDGFKFVPVSTNCHTKENSNADSFKIFETCKKIDIATCLINETSISPKNKSNSLMIESKTVNKLSHIPENVAVKTPVNMSTLSQKIEETIMPTGLEQILSSCTSIVKPNSEVQTPKTKHHSGERRRRNKSHRLKREQIRAQLQFEDPHSMECGNDLNDFLSSSSLSSSDSDDGQTNESDHEGDDELTDWPGNEAMVNFASKNDFKKRSNKKFLPLIKSSDDYAAGGDDDTLMSGDEILSPPGGLVGGGLSMGIQIKPTMLQSQPIKINSGNFMNFNSGLGGSDGLYDGASNSFGLSENLSGGGNSYGIGRTSDSFNKHTTNFRFPVKQIESEMSGETSNPFLPSSPCKSNEIREIRAGCRRIREERPGFIVKTSVNERLARFLQDARQTSIRLPDLEMHEQDSLLNLAKLYSLQMSNENGCAVLRKTSNTTQSVKIDQPNFSHRFLFNDYKRRCFETNSLNSFENESSNNFVKCSLDSSFSNTFENQSSTRIVKENPSADFENSQIINQTLTSATINPHIIS